MLPLEYVGLRVPESERPDYLKRFAEVEPIKQALRQRYVSSEYRTPTKDPDVFRARSSAFWAEYEDLNRLWIPEDPVYPIAKQGVALSTTNDLWEAGWSAGAGMSRILECYLSGEAAASAVVRASANRVTTQGTGTAPTAYTPDKMNPLSPAAAGTYYGALTANVTWGTAQATLAANSLFVLTFNAFGGSDRWIAQPGGETFMLQTSGTFAAGGWISLRSLSGTSTCSGHVMVEEL